ncbi:hypothetical protein ACRE_075720 [Hapsidospora chrysogenum ATCC 11550]|uniref:Uncharacterized protein n=1 Tax=Hapsidospora chrysogenum (strain ATCC 11550 / CBS 779.69 / DSM 880 / IAM 14645 / JCM 23072 / IMI 49137) TaxID=857340 RepID=A0A086SX72_HAPC1|nr:hypothetical protein ACRE_075720 [Hapsidospora chrysogenum ATCC 11550]
MLCVVTPQTKESQDSQDFLFGYFLKRFGLTPPCHQKQHRRHTTSTSRLMPHRVDSVAQPRKMTRRKSSAGSISSSSQLSSPASPAASIVPGSTIPPPSAWNASVVQALELARESPEAGQDPTINKILNDAIRHIWHKIQTQPYSYVMTGVEFSVFNYFQHLFLDEDKADLARMARARYWDNAHA